MPEQNDESPDFEVWKSNFFKESTKGDASKLMEMISPMRDKETLEPYQRKFVDDNWNIQLLRMNSNVASASKQIRKSIREQLDKNNPSTSVVNHIFNTLESVPSLNETFIKMMGYSGNKGELHRKFIAALTGSVQVSSSPDKENIIFNEKEYSIKMATRLNSDWGEVALGSWSLREDDPERYLSAPELKRLSEGSPQERDVLRRRIVIESIAKQFEEQSFIIDVVNDEGTIYHLGWDMSNALRGAYTEGKVVVKAVKSENSEAMISDDGQIVPMVDLKIYFVKETGGQDQFGNPEVDEIEFMERRNGMLFLTAGLVTIKEASESMQGTELKEVPYPGNPSDLKALKRCVYSTHDLLMRQC
ncbi:MAG: hypothetical protein EBT03_12390 [Betaproteobacteria bacterium]|nr:hypothetical protein [Betaproteobacteria bacterium]